MLFVSKLRLWLRDYRMKKYAQCYSIHPSCQLTSEFIVNVLFPQNRLFLEVGERNILACEFRFESTGGHIRIGNDCYIGPSLLISRNDIEIGNHVTIAWGCTIYDHDSHSLDYRERREDIKREIANLNKGVNFIIDKDWDTVNSSPIVIKDDAWIGMNVIILKGVTIGRGAVVGAGSVVTKDVPDWAVVAGNPAKIVKVLNPKE